MIRALRPLARLYPWSVDPDPEVRRAVAYLDPEAGAATVLRASYGLALTLGLVAVPLLALAPAGPWVALPPLAAAALAAWGGPAAARLIARARRTRALGAAPSLVTHATARMRLSPTPERAAAYAAAACEGALAGSLGDHVRRAAGDGRTGLASFADEWEPWFPALERACALVESAGRASPERRPATLDRARRAVLDGVADRAASFAAAIRGPATALYAFGVLLPLSLVALLPAVRTAGIDVPLPVVVALYDVALPLVLVVAGGWLLVRRPVAFPPTPVPPDHPETPDSRLPAALLGLAAGAAAWPVAARVAPAWTVPLAAAGIGVGAGLVAAFRPVVAVRRDVAAVEAGLSDALAVVGRRVADGTAVERAIAAAGEELPGPAGDRLADAARVRRRLGVAVESALLGPAGALAGCPSRRARGVARLFALAAREGAPAGEALLAMADHLDELGAVEDEARRSVGRVTGTLRNTAAVFAPLVGGATVAMADAMGSAGPFGGAGGPDVSGLGLAVGVYVLLLAVLLTALATGLERGFDRPLVGYRAGLALLAATATYLTALVGTGLTV